MEQSWKKSPPNSGNEGKKLIIEFTCTPADIGEGAAWTNFDDISLIKRIPENPKGHTYYLRHRMNRYQKDNAFVIGDAAGLATLDMGEGIHAAIASGILAAKAIVGKQEVQSGLLEKFSFWEKFSLPGMMFPKTRSRKKDF